jgi:predicted Zn-dependent protease with MMP-like domain
MSGSRRERLAAYRHSQRRYRPDRRRFEQLVQEALAALPIEFRRRLVNVAVVVQEWPSADQSRDGRTEDGPLLGLYQGTPYGLRGQGYHLQPPDRITLFRGPLLSLGHSRAELVQEIRDTVVHEVGHYFGLAEEELP